MVDPRLISFIARSKRRKEVLKLFLNGQKSQVEVMKETNMYKSHTSRTIKELLDKKLIVCKNPEDREYKFYEITGAGKGVLGKVEKL